MKLSRRELTVLYLLGFGLSEREIALELGVSRSAVQTYRRRMVAKMWLQVEGEPCVVRAASVQSAATSS